jgi:ArsR family transcriptional regulator, arsenate/arsenite/antimonite-responsive transcriptional repressor
LTVAALPTSVASPVLSEAEAAAAAALFRVLADPTRVRIVNLLANRGEPACVCHLVDELGLAQATVSHHVRKLVDVGLVTREERGKWTFLSIDADACRRLGTLVDFESCC